MSVPGREVLWQAVGFMAGLCSLGLGHNGGVTPLCRSAPGLPGEALGQRWHPRDRRDSTTPGSAQLPLTCQLTLYKVPLVLQGQV